MAHLCLKRATTATGFGGIGVAESESSFVEVIAEIEDRAIEIQ